MSIKIFYSHLSSEQEKLPKNSLLCIIYI